MGKHGKQGREGGQMEMGGVGSTFSCSAVLTWPSAAAAPLSLQTHFPFSPPFPSPVFYPLKHHHFSSLSFLQDSRWPVVFFFTLSVFIYLPSSETC